MTGVYEPAYEPDSAPARPAVDAARLWRGGAATALIAALITVVGILLVRGLFGVPVLTPKGKGVWAMRAPLAFVTVVTMLAPFTTNETTASKVATALLNLVLGIAIGSLVAGSARSAMLSAPRRPAPDSYR